ncbi:MAG: DUF2798 domain-containing protein [Gammaproteobacteria bacterium]|nr:DUF2798 domain-containing protein [Gammaproteobacteria bacterium]
MGINPIGNYHLRSIFVVKKLVFPVFMSCYMALLMTCLITYINTGFDAGF